jgi:quinol monooxygenase YgiN
MWTQESTMIQVLVHHQVNDYKNWRSVFDAALDFRHEGGECSCRIFRKAGNPNDLTLLFEWEDMERAQHYMSSDELRDKMRQAGVMGVPEVQYLAEMYTVRRSAAD